MKTQKSVSNSATECCSAEEDVDPSLESSHIFGGSRGPQLMEEEESPLRERHLTRIYPSFLHFSIVHTFLNEWLRWTHVALFSPFLSGNPLVCSCSSYTQKIWMRQHRKWLDTERRGPKVGPQCAEPRSLEDRHLLAVKVNWLINFTI